MRGISVIAALLCLAGGTVPALALDYEEYPTIRLRSLDKVTARTLTFDAQVGSTIKFGDIYIKIQSCRKPPPVEKSESAAFLQIWQIDKASQESRWIFSGWMFASSPALSGMDHPVYDVWVIDCLGKDPEALPPEETKQSEAFPDEGTVPEGTVAQPDIAPEDQQPTNPASASVKDNAAEDKSQQPPEGEETNSPTPSTPEKRDEAIDGIY